MAALTAALVYAPVSHIAPRLWQLGGAGWALKFIVLLLPQALVVAIPCTVLMVGLLGSTRRSRGDGRPLAAAAFARCLMGLSAGAAILTLVTLVWAVPSANQAFREFEYRVATGHPAPVSLAKGTPEMTISELAEARRDPHRAPRYRAEAAIQLHYRFAIPAAAVAFGLASVALVRRGQASRRPLGVAILMWCAVVFAYYMLLFCGRTLATEFTLCPPWLGAWSANILIAAFAVAVGARRLRRTEAPAAA